VGLLGLNFIDELLLALTFHGLLQFISYLNLTFE